MNNKKIKFVRYEHDGTQMVHHGTCDFCEYTVMEDEANPRLAFTDPDGQEFTVNLETWSWGDRFEAYPHNTLEFVLWLEERGVTPDELANLQRDHWPTINDLVDEYEEHHEV